MDTLVLPSDLNALLERLDILMSSKTDGNTGIRNELVYICDKLLRQNVIDKHTLNKIRYKYKNISYKENLQKMQYVIGSAGICYSIGKFFCENIFPVMQQKN